METRIIEGLGLEGCGVCVFGFSQRPHHPLVCHHGGRGVHGGGVRHKVGHLEALVAHVLLILPSQEEGLRRQNQETLSCWLGSLSQRE